MENLKAVDFEKLEEIKMALIDKWADEMSFDDLVDYYKDGTEDFLNNSTTEQILEWAKEANIKV